MGVDLYNLAFLLEARKRRGPFGELLQVGRQAMFVPEAAYEKADTVVRQSGLGESFHGLVGQNAYADRVLFPNLGATRIVAVDASPYEGAQIVHDFNEPVPAPLHQTFDTIFDGGSLEHIFNVPTALANMMNMLRPGGFLLSSLPANNWLGHGFYQFGPELPFRVFTPGNGFRIEAVFIGHTSGDVNLWEMTDTGAEGVRNEIGATREGAGLMFIAQKLEHVRPFSRWPQQGDYAAIWQHASSPQPSRPGLVTRGLNRLKRALRS